jgi:hypothetical protein
LKTNKKIVATQKQNEEIVKKEKKVWSKSKELYKRIGKNHPMGINISSISGRRSLLLMTLWQSSGA